MNIRKPLFLLFGVVAASPILAANPSNLTPDVQAQAAGLLKVETFPPSSRQEVSSRSHAVGSEPYASAQMQAANILKGNQTAASATSRVADASPHHGNDAALLEKAGTASQDVQTQAQQLLRSASPSSGNGSYVRAIAAVR